MDDTKLVTIIELLELEKDNIQEDIGGLDSTIFDKYKILKRMKQDITEDTTEEEIFIDNTKVLEIIGLLCDVVSLAKYREGLRRTLNDMEQKIQENTTSNTTEDTTEEIW